MAKYERIVEGNFTEILDALHRAVMEGSLSASLEESSDYAQGGFSCAVRVYERYSWTGSNRLSMTLTLAGAEGRYFVSAITSGGSQAVFFKVNTWGENAFLDTIVSAIQSL